MGPQKKRDAFVQERVPLPPMTPCAACGHEGGHEGELFALVEGDKWLCRECFFKGTGRSWPRSQGAKLTPVSTSTNVRRPTSWKSATTNRGGK